MRYRILDANDDYSFGGGAANFYIDQPEAVGQAVRTRLELKLGEWMLDTTDGTPWNTEVLGHNTAGTRDVVIQDRIDGTTGFSDFVTYSSTVDPNTRSLTVTTTIDTIYGQTPVVATL